MVVVTGRGRGIGEIMSDTESTEDAEFDLSQPEEEEQTETTTTSNPDDTTAPKQKKARRTHDRKLSDNSNSRTTFGDSATNLNDAMGTSSSSTPPRKAAYYNHNHNTGYDGDTEVECIVDTPSPSPTKFASPGRRLAMRAVTDSRSTSAASNRSSSSSSSSRATTTATATTSNGSSSSTTTSGTTTSKATPAPSKMKLKNQQVYRVLLTGGPCGGKSSALATLNDELTRRGFHVITVPETATTVLVLWIFYSL